MPPLLARAWELVAIERMLRLGARCASGARVKRRCVFAVVLVVVVIPVSVAGCGGARISQMGQALTTMQRMAAGFGNFSPTAWDSMVVRHVQLRAVGQMPRTGTRGVFAAEGRATVAVGVALNSLTPTQQRLVAPGGSIVTEAVRVTAAVAKDHGRWSAQRVFDVGLLPAPLRLTDYARARNAALGAMRSLFTYAGGAYAHAQRGFYATTVVAGVRDPALGLVPLATPNLAEASASLYGADCLLSAGFPLELVLAEEMRPMDLRITRARALDDLPPTIQVNGRIGVAIGRWSTSVKGYKGCTPTMATFSFDAVMVRSLTSGRWLVGQVDTGGGNRLYPGLQSW